MASSALFDRPVAHRGLHDRASGIIENSAAAFEAAIARGYAIECDLQLSADGVPMVFHDVELERLTGRRGKVSDLTAREIGALPLIASAGGDCPLRFAELIEIVRGRVPLMAELKRQPGPAALVLARAAAEVAADYSGNLAFISFDPGLLAKVRAFGFDGRKGIITYAYDKPEWDGFLSPVQRVLLRHLLHYPWSRFDFISVEQSSVGLGAVRLFRALGTPVVSWTIRSAEAAATVSMHTDQIVFEGFEP